MLRNLQNLEIHFSRMLIQQEKLVNKYYLNFKHLKLK